MSNIIISTVIPCYNEDKNIPLIFDKIKNYANNKELEFIFIDNGSFDNTRKEIKKYMKKYNSVKLVIIEKNIGYGNGIFQGLKEASGNYIGWTHADLQTDPKDVIRVLNIIKRKKYPKKFYVKGKRYGRPLVDKLVNTLGMSLFETLILGKIMYDINAQPNIFSRDLLNYMTNPPIDFSFDLYIYYLAKRKKFRVERLPVFFGERIFGESNWNTGWKARIKFIKRTIKFSLKLKRNL